MPDLNIKINPSQLEEITETLRGVPAGLGKAQSAAINLTLRHVRAVAARQIKKHINLPIARIKEAITTRKATPGHLSGLVRFNRRPVPLIDYGAKDIRPGGVTVKVRRDQGQQTFRHAFIATMPNGHVGVFERIHGSFHRAGWRKGWQKVNREKIKQLFGPSVEGTFAGAPGVADEVMADSGAFFQKQLASQVNRLLHRKKVDETPGAEEE